MTKPEFVIRLSSRTAGGSLRTSDLRLIKSKLTAQGFVLLPSDTCYSLAAYAVYDDTHSNINKILSRGEEPISLCASNYEEALKWIDNSNHTAITLLEQFTPGPITVVCTTSDTVRQRVRFFRNAIAAKNGTIGMRISDSIVERQVSATNENYLITTTAVRDPASKRAITEFNKALEIVQRGIKAFGRAGWGAIEGGGFFERHSTVVEASREGRLQLIREGGIPFSKIEAASRIMPSTMYEDWG